MLKLNLSREPFWLDLGHGVEVRVRPMTTTLMMRARSHPAVRAAVDAVSGQTTDEAAAVQVLVQSDAFLPELTRAAAREGIVDWRGVGDDAGTPVNVTDERVDALMELWPIFQAFQRKYVLSINLLGEEKNGFAPSPSGTSERAPSTATTAKSDAQSAPET